MTKDVFFWSPLGYLFFLLFGKWRCATRTSSIFVNEEMVKSWCPKVKEGLIDGGREGDLILLPRKKMIKFGAQKESRLLLSPSLTKNSSLGAKQQTCWQHQKSFKAPEMKKNRERGNPTELLMKNYWLGRKSVMKKAA